jgi:uncharacterized protein
VGMRDVTYRRPAFEELARRIEEPRRFIQVLTGPRQVGKTTLADQVVSVVSLPVHQASADDPAGRDGTWLRVEWGAARRLTGRDGQIAALLVLDEIHKIPSWSDIVKSLWDEDTRSGSALRVMVLGSSPLLMARGLTESLAGRFELTRLPHWSFTEMRQAFGWDDVDRFVYFGGYPGAAGLVDEPGRWRRYIQDSMIETTLSRDVLLLQPIQKPALLRQLFRLGCDYSSQELSFRKMTGQLEDAGSTVTLAHYLELLSGAGMLAGLRKFSGTRVVQRSSSPKLLVMNTALMSASLGKTYDEMRSAPELWGRLVESAAGAHLLAGIEDADADLLYWRDGAHEVDFVVRRGRQVLAIEVTSGRRKRSMEGMTAFVDRFGSHFEIRSLLVGGQGLDLAEFLSRSVGDLLRQ